MKFKILENVLTTFRRLGDVYYIYKNPTSQELNSKEDSKENRGIIDKEGNLYIEAKWVRDDNIWSGVIHNHLLNELQLLDILKEVETHWWEESSDSVNYAVFVQREEDTLDFYLAESYETEVNMNKDKVNKILEKAEEKNPRLFFHCRIFGGRD